MGVIWASRLPFWLLVTVTVSTVTGVVRTSCNLVSISVEIRVIVLRKSVSRYDGDRMPNLHNRGEFFHNGAVGVADTKDLAKVLTECAVVHEVVVLILVAKILLAFEKATEPTEDGIGRLRFIVSLLELSVRMRDAGKSEGAKKREAQGHCDEGLHGEHRKLASEAEV